MPVDPGNRPHPHWPLSGIGRVPAHTLPVAALPGFDLPIGPGGLVVGQDPAGRPAILRLFRPTPVRIGVYGGGYFVSLLALRAVAHGAQVVVATARPEGWAALVRAAPPGPAWVTVLPPASPTPPAGSMLRPSLLVEDAEVGQGGARHDLGGWQAAVTFEPVLTDAASQSLRLFDLAVLARPGRQGLRPVQDAFRLPADDLRWLPQMPADVVALVTAGRCRFVRLVPSAVEQATFGPPPSGPAGPGG